MKSDGIIYYDKKYGFWTGTYVEMTNDEGIRQCLAYAKEVSGGELPPDGTIVPIKFTFAEIPGFQDKVEMAMAQEEQAKNGGDVIGQIASTPAVVPKPGGDTIGQIAGDMM